MRNEINLLKKMLKASKFDAIDVMADQMKRINFEIEILNNSIDSCCSMKDIEELQ